MRGTTKRTWTVVGMVAASLLGGALSNLLLVNAVGAQGGAEVVTTTQLNLVDGAGRLRGTLSGSDARGLTSLALYDDRGQVRGVFGVESGGTPVVELLDAQGQRRVLVTTEGDEPLVVLGLESESQGLFGVLQGAPMLTLGDGTQSRAVLHLNAAGLPRLALSDGAGQQTAALHVGTDDLPQLTLSAAGRPRAVFGVVNDAAVLNLADATRPRLAFGVAEDGRPSINFLDENGEIVSGLP